MSRTLSNVLSITYTNTTLGKTTQLTLSITRLTVHTSNKPLPISDPNPTMQETNGEQLRKPPTVDKLTYFNSVTCDLTVKALKQIKRLSIRLLKLDVPSQ